MSLPGPVLVPVVFDVNVLDRPDWEDNRILDLAAAVGAFLVVSADADLTRMAGAQVPRTGW